MQTPDRDDIHIISHHSNRTADIVQQQLLGNVYPNAAGWRKFLQLFLLGAGVAFTVSGIIFFFAYNWDNLGKFAKMGTVGGVLTATVLIVLLTNLSDLVKNILLTGAAVLVGGLFAVYGQIYQTGADTYELFLAWSVFVTLWVVVSGFAPLWLLYLLLINTTGTLYLAQYHSDLQAVTLLLIELLFNSFCLVAALVVNAINGRLSAPDWFTNLLAIGCASMATSGVIAGIIEHQNLMPAMLLVTIAAYAAGLWYGFTRRKVLYFALIAFSAICCIAAGMIKVSHDTGMFLLVSLFIIGAVTITVQQIIKLQKRWANV
jgi:uncharacterized membrane protein